jgi:protection-of-telomeres protein 1
MLWLDHKCTFEVVDHSDYDSRGLKINIFWPLVKMPDVWNGDAILIRKAKVRPLKPSSRLLTTNNPQLQMWSGSVSLLGNYATEIHVLQTKKIPEAISEAPKVPWQSYSYDSQNHRPTTVETSYVMWAKNHGGLDLLSDTEFNEKKDRAMKVKDKFSLLKDVKDTCYYNILGEVIRVYDGSSNTVTVYLSDYTANSKFYNHAWGEGGEAVATTGDKYGYLRPFSKPKAAKDWPGPYGKMCIQITLFDEHAIYVRESVKVNQWVFMKNVHMKFGKTGGILEGDLHGDCGKILVSVMEQADDPDGSVDEKWKKAVGRKLEYEQKFKKQKQDIQRLGDKRKVGGEEPAKLNNKMRRKAERAAGLKKGAAAETRVMTNLDLNENSKQH